ncbi:hypothetical protein [Herbiconiux flava]|uniref:TRAP-type C4-dicarboxylate transport system permease small subunit n=1 Tax=Herbiconiux flava TaxID=881268 RepID=A0A852SSM1_9MICO|nr:hypothetical protein [Herbiconiux flava]NYD71879.1 TRAP-type C4-dicarboxylate transport system permease small subunit [Herbiconiux flava]GLK18158.1 hypothetical protein GCM10017602_26400 [Herbiconiux flava]
MTLSLLTTTVGAVIADERIPDPDSVTPGIIGFIVTFGIAIVTLLLVIDMVRRVRRVNLRAQVREELEAEIAARDASAGGPEGTVPEPGPEAAPPSR